MSALNAKIAASRSTRTKLNRRLPGVAQLAGSRTRDKRFARRPNLFRTVGGFAQFRRFGTASLQVSP
jgi:hypothetical protein